GDLINPRARRPLPAAGVFTRIVYGEGWTGSAGRSLAFRLEGVRQQAGRRIETDQGVVRRDVMIRSACCLALTLAVIPTAALAQGSVTIFGTVTDALGSVVPGATITATNARTALERVTACDANGNYAISQLPVGVYTVKAELSGFKTFRLDRVQTQVDGNRRVNVVMELGQLTESVTVAGDTAQVDTRSGTLREVVDSQRIVELPLNGRNPLQLQLLVAGAGGRAGHGHAETGAGAVN